tara:strand:+ start:460 stop:633 length:174 start_codon:yes stop_codon:yes gene_type:complete
MRPVKEDSISSLISVVIKINIFINTITQDDKVKHVGQRVRRSLEKWKSSGRVVEEWC